MNMVLAIAACAILALLAFFQVALASGAPLGEFAWGGQSRVLPRRLRIGSVVSIIIYGLIAVILLERTGLVSLFGNEAVVQVTAWVVFAYFALGIVLNGVSRSKRERYTMTPIVIVLAALTFVVALG